MDIQNYRLDSANEKNKYFKTETLTDYLVVLSNAVNEKNTCRVFDAIETILNRAKSLYSSNNTEQIKYVKKRITDALVEVYRDEIVRQYEEMINHSEIYISNVPSNFSEDIYKYDPEARKRAKARDILEDKYRTSIYGGYMTKVITRIIKEHEERKYKFSALSITPGLIRTKTSSIRKTTIPADKEAYIAKVKKEIKDIYDHDDR